MNCFAGNYGHFEDILVGSFAGSFATDFKAFYGNFCRHFCEILQAFSPANSINVNETLLARLF